MRDYISDSLDGLRSALRNNPDGFFTGGSILTIAGLGVAGIVSWPVGIGVAIVGITGLLGGVAHQGSFNTDSLTLSSNTVAPHPTHHMAEATPPQRDVAAVSVDTEPQAPRTPKVNRQPNQLG